MDGGFFGSDGSSKGSELTLEDMGEAYDPLARNDLLDRVCAKHKKLIAPLAKAEGYPPSALKVMSCERLKRSIADWFNCTSDGTLNQLYRLTKVIDKLEQKKMLKFAVIGGSVELGKSDYYKVGGHLGAWPAKLEKMLLKVWPGLVIENLAHGGYDTEQHLRVFDRYTKKEYDMYLLQFAINEQVDLELVERQKDLVPRISAKFYKLLLSRRNQPAVLNIELFRSELKDKEDAKSHCPGAMRKLPNDVYFCDQWWYPQTWRTKARRQYRVPMISYRDAVFPDLQNPPSDINTTWSGHSHPGPRVHFWIAETIFYGMMVLRETVIENNKLIVQDESVCIKKTTSMDANDGKAKFEPVKSGCGWHFGEDVAGKPGWIIEKGKKNTGKCDLTNKRSLKISFKLMTGKTGLITGSHLVSYDERMGRAKVWVNSGVNDALVLDSKIKSHVSIPQGFEIRLDKSLRNQYVTVTFQLLVSPNDPDRPSKFKLLTLDSC